MEKKTITENQYVYSAKNKFALAVIIVLAATGIYAAIFEAYDLKEALFDLGAAAFFGGIAAFTIWKDKRTWKKEKLGRG